jgi:hypothetical protein
LLNARHPVLPGKRLVVPEGMTPATAMVAADSPAKPRYDDGVYVPAPGLSDWLFHSPDGTGSTIGPSPQQSREAALRRARERRQAKGGKP